MIPASSLHGLKKIFKLIPRPWRRDVAVDYKKYTVHAYSFPKFTIHPPLVLLLLTGGHFRWDVSIVCISTEVLQQIFSSSEDPGRLLFGWMRKCMVLVWCDWSISSMDARDAEEQRTLALGRSLFWCSLLRVWNERSLDVVDPCMTTCLNHPKFSPFIEFNSWWGTLPIILGDLCALGCKGLLSGIALV